MCGFSYISLCTRSLAPHNRNIYISKTMAERGRLEKTLVGMTLVGIKSRTLCYPTGEVLLPFIRMEHSS